MPDHTSSLSAALARFQADDLAGAEALCRDALTVDQENVEALHLFGVIAHRGGRNDIAVEYVRRAVAVQVQVWLHCVGWRFVDSGSAVDVVWVG